MKFGCCVNMLSREKIRIGHEHIPLVKELGFDYVELPTAQVMELSEAAFTAGPLKAVQESGLPCLRMNNFLPGHLRLTGPEADHAEALHFVRQAFERAQRLGVKVIVMGSAGARNRPIGTDREQATEQMLQFLLAMAPLAQEKGITIAIEHLNKLESNLITSYEEGCRLARMANHPAIGVLFDSYHQSMVNEPISTLRGSGDILRHVHLARTLGRTFPQPGDEDHFEQMFAELKGIGYQGTLSFECNADEDFAADAVRALAYMRGLAG